MLTAAHRSAGVASAEQLESRCLLSPIPCPAAGALCEDGAPLPALSEPAPSTTSEVQPVHGRIRIASGESDDPSQPVNIPDPNLETAIRVALNKPSGQITDADMLTLTTLDASGRGITNLSGLEAAENLQTLNLSANFQISDISPLAGLTKLQNLDLS